MTEEQIRDLWNRERPKALTHMREQAKGFIGVGQWSAQAFGDLTVDWSVQSAEQPAEAIIFVYRKEPDGSAKVTSGDFQIEVFPPREIREWGGKTLEGLASHVNSMPFGDRVRIPATVLSGLSYNWSQYQGLFHALRGQVIGSNYGVVRMVDDFHYDGWTLEKCYPSQRIYDRDGHPISEKAQ